LAGFLTAQENANRTIERRRSGFIVDGLEFGLKIAENKK
jgi:hypothetical protein